MITLYQIRPDGIYVQDRHYETMPDPRPIRFLTDSPHPIPAEHFAMFLGGQWRYISGQAPPWRPDPGPEPPSLDELKTTIKKEIDEIRYSFIYMESIPYTFPGDTEPDGIQMRDETDRQNIQDFVIDASNKAPETVMYWMPVSNNVKAMTAAQAVEMGQSLKARGDQIMSHSWNLKAQIKTAATFEALEEINITEGWPE